MPHFKSDPDNLCRLLRNWHISHVDVVSRRLWHNFSWYLEGTRLRPPSNLATEKLPALKNFYIYKSGIRTYAYLSLKNKSNFKTNTWALSKRSNLPARIFWCRGLEEQLAIREAWPYPLFQKLVCILDHHPTLKSSVWALIEVTTCYIYRAILFSEQSTIFRQQWYLYWTRDCTYQAAT